MIKNKFLAVGVMSGTSMDGIDISLILSDGKKSYKHIKSKFYSYKKSTKTILSKLVDSFSVSKHSLALISSTEELVTFEFITALKNFLKDQNLSKIDLIALHGQTVFHDPINKSSIQLCDELKIKSSLKLPIVSDFRQKDLSLGGARCSTYSNISPINYAKIRNYFASLFCQYWGNIKHNSYR